MEANERFCATTPAKGTIDSCFGYGMAANARAAQAKMRGGHRTRPARALAGPAASRVSMPISAGTRDRRRVVSIGIGQSQINFSAMLNKPDDAPLNRKRLIASQSENAAARAASNETKSSRNRSARAKFRAGVQENPYEGPPRRMIRRGGGAARFDGDFANGCI
ncbi:hypothetical protein [Burkholderia pseudomallei]|uniref:hypothetical protein n=1 Tax=Burkholderia pseudomallei TaxID=28450 RepID=UPI0015E0D754|nr:hypothetical protein [Burkholderia pseudomallei]